MKTNTEYLNDNNVNSFPVQRIKDHHKRKPEFYIRCANYIIDRAQSENNKSKTIERIKHANGEIDEKTIAYALKPFSKDIDSQDKQLRFPSMSRDIDIITPIKERYMGEYIKQYSNFQVYIHDSDSVFIRNKELAKAVASEMVKKLQEVIDSGDEAALNNLDLNKFSKEFIAEWADERVIKGQKRLNLINDLTNANIQYIQAFFYWWACEEVYSYREIVEGELIKEIIPPWEYYRIDSGNLFVEDDDMGMRKYKMSINQIIDRDRNKLSEKDLEYLKSLLLKTKNYNETDIEVSLLQSRDTFDIYKPDIANLDGIAFGDTSGMVNVYDCFWKTETLIYNLKYMDLMTGEIKTIQVPQDYKLDVTAGDISLTDEWISEVYKVRRYGEKYEGIYLPAEPVEVQRQEINNISICKLPVNGIVGMLKNNAIKPIPTRLIPYQLLLKLYTFQQEKAIAKFKTFNIMPESILLDSTEMTIEERLAYAATDDILPFNDENIEPALLQAIKSMYNQGAERYIQILQEIRQALKQEAMDVANMNEQRYGDINQQAGKSVTEYAITKATTGSILMFEMFNKFRERDHEADLDYSKAAWVDGKQGSYIDSNTKEVVYIDIDGTEELGTNLGVFIRNSALEEEKLKSYREIAFAASQNGEFDLAVDAIHSENSTEIRRLIKKATEAKREYEKSIEDSRNAIQQEIEQMKQQAIEKEMVHEKDLQNVKDLAETQRLAMKLEVEMIKIQSSIDNLSNDIDNESKRKLEQANLQLQKDKAAIDRQLAIKKLNEPAKTATTK